MTPEAVGVALGIVSRSFEKQSAREAVGTVGWLLLTVLKGSTEVTQEMAAQEHKRQTSVDSLRKEMALMWEEAAREPQQQGDIGDETAVLPGVLKEEETIKEKDELLREAQAEVA